MFPYNGMRNKTSKRLRLSKNVPLISKGVGMDEDGVDGFGVNEEEMNEGQR